MGLINKIRRKSQEIYNKKAPLEEGAFLNTLWVFELIHPSAWRHLGHHGFFFFRFFGYHRLGR